MKRSLTSAAGGMKTVLFLLFLEIAALWGGGQGLYTALTNLEPATFTYDQYVQRKPPQKWLRLTGAMLRVPATSYSAVRLTETITRVYAPVHSAGSSAAEKVPILSATKDKGLTGLVIDMRKAPDTEAVKFLFEIGARLYPNRDIQGLVRFGIEMKSDDRKDLAKLNANLAKDFVVIDDGEKPDWFMSLALLAIGVALPVWFVSKARKAPAPEAAPAPARAAGPGRA